MNRTAVLAFTCFFLFLSARAQVGVSVGARAGFDFSHYRKYTAPDLFKKREIIGSDLAVILRIDFNKYIGIQTEVEFLQKGQGWKRTQDSAKYTGKFVASYIQFPILAVARFGNQKVKALLQAGPYLAYWAGGYSQNAVSIDRQTRHEDHTKYVFTKNDMRLDVGIVAGAGADIKVGKGWIEVAARYNAGFLNTVKNSASASNGKLFNSSFSISVGYLYTLK